MENLCRIWILFIKFRFDLKKLKKHKRQHNELDVKPIIWFRFNLTKIVNENIRKFGKVQTASLHVEISCESDVVIFFIIAKKCN